jgi:hypothetical protein
MPGLYSIATRAPGTIVTALVYNADHQAHVDGRTAVFMGGHSGSLSQMQLVSNPFPTGVENQAVSLAVEIEQLRFEIALLLGYLSGGDPVSPWYAAPAAVALPTIGARVQVLTSQSIPDSVATTITFAGNTADFNSGIWVGGNPTRFTAPSTGKYYAFCSVLWDGTPLVGVRQLRIGVNGVFSSQPFLTNTLFTSSTTQQHQALTGFMQLNATDFVEFQAFQGSGTAVPLIGSAKESIVGGLMFMGS